MKDETKKSGTYSKNTKTKRTDKEEDETEDVVFLARAHVTEASIVDDEQM